MPQSTPRKGARRRADIPPDVLQALTEGRMETRTLVEFLAIDLAILVGHALRDAPLPDASRARVVAHARSLASEGITRRLTGIGEALQRAAEETGVVEALRAHLAAHRSDVVRELACAMVQADASLTPEARLALTRPFADDPNMGVREIAWTSLRPYVLAEPDAWLARLEPWTRDASANVRRCAIEGTRPRAVWAPMFPLLVREPERALSLLENVRSDPSRYVQTSVGNWLNDASKSRADFVRALVARWERESPTPETAWILKHATRTLRKKAAAQA